MQIRYIALLVTVLVVSTASVTVAEAEAYTVDPALIQAVQGYAAETQHGDAHQERWNRVLAAFGTITHANPMTAQEAQTYVDKGWNRWVPVTAALAALEQAAAQQTDPEPQQTEETDPQTNLADVDQTVIDTVTDWRNEQAAGTAHYERWDRVLAAFGTVDRNDPMTAQEAQTYVDRGWQRWVDITAILKDIEAADQPQQQQQDQPQQQQQQGALENPQYTPQQDQLPSTQQSQQQNQAIIDEYRQVKTRAENLVDTVVDLNNIAYNKRVEYPDLWNQIRILYYPTTLPNNNLGLLVLRGDSYERNNDYAALDNQITKIKAAISFTEDTIFQMRTLLTNVVYGPVEFCPQIDPTTNKALVRYIEAEKVFVKTIPKGGDPPEGYTYSHATPTHTVYTKTDGTLKHDLTERICAYHDLDYGENHRNMVKEAMLALGIDPEADGIEPMSAERAFEIQQRYDNSRYDWPEGDDGWPAWQERIWQDIKKEIRNIEHDRHYEENYDYINDQLTEEEQCAMPSVTCEYTHKPVNTREGSYDYYWVHKMTTTTDGVTTLIQEWYENGNYKKITAYDENGFKSSEVAYFDTTLQYINDGNANHAQNEITYHPDSTQKAKEITRTPDNHVLGSFKEWYPNGNFKLSISNFEHGTGLVKQGTFYDENQKRRVQITTNNPVVCYQADGNTSETCGYDHRDGVYYLTIKKYF